MNVLLQFSYKIEKRKCQKHSGTRPLFFFVLGGGVRDWGLFVLEMAWLHFCIIEYYQDIIVLSENMHDLKGRIRVLLFYLSISCSIITCLSIVCCIMHWRFLY